MYVWFDKAVVSWLGCPPPPVMTIHITQAGENPPQQATNSLLPQKSSKMASRSASNGIMLPDNNPFSPFSPSPWPQEGYHASLLLLVNVWVLTGYVLFVTNFAAIRVDKFAEYVVATSKYTDSVTASNNKPRHPSQIPYYCAVVRTITRRWDKRDIEEEMKRSEIRGKSFSY